MLLRENTVLWKKLFDRNEELENKKVPTAFQIQSISIDSHQEHTQRITSDVVFPNRPSPVKITSTRFDVAHILKTALSTEHYTVDDATTNSLADIINVFNDSYNTRFDEDELLLTHLGAGRVKISIRENNPVYYGHFIVTDPNYVPATNPNAGGGAGIWGALGW